MKPRVLLPLALLGVLFAGPASAALAPTFGIDELILRARRCVEAELGADGRLTVRSVLFGPGEAGETIRVQPARIPQFETEPWKGAPLPEGSRLLVFLDEQGRPVLSGVVLLRDGRAVRAQQFVNPGPQMFRLDDASMEASETESALVRRIHARRAYLDDLRKRVAADPDPAWVLGCIREAHRLSFDADFGPSWTLLRMLATELAKTGSDEQVVEAFLQPSVDPYPLRERLEPPAAQTLLYKRGLMNAQLSDAARARCAEHLHVEEYLTRIPSLIRVAGDGDDLAESLCRVLTRKMQGAKSADDLFRALVNLHRTGEANERFAIAHAVWLNLPDRYAQLGAPAAAYPVALKCLYGGEEPRFLIRRPQRDGLEGIDRPGTLVLVPLRGGKTLELPVEPGYLKMSNHIFPAKGLADVPAGRYWAYLRIGETDESYGCTVAFR